MIGYTHKQVKTKLEHLYSVSRYRDSDTKTMFDIVYSALDFYYNRNQEFKEQGYKTFKRVVMSSLYRNLQCSRMDLLPKWNNNFPKGYNRISDIFQTATLQEIMTISDATFNSAFSRVEKSSSENGDNDSNSDSSSSSEKEYETHNTYLENWALKIDSAVGNELQLLKDLENYCLFGYEDISMAFIFEDLGHIWNSYTDDKRSFAELVYIKHRWDWFERTFKCGIYQPSYIDELRK